MYRLFCFATPLARKESAGELFIAGKMIGIRHPVYHNVDRKTRVEPDGRRLVKMTEIGEETLKQYRGYLADREKSIATIDKYLRDIRTFLQWMGENRSITKEKVIAYKAWLQEHYKTSSANSMLVALNGFLDFMGETQSRVKTVKVQKQMFRSTEKEISRAEYKKLIEKAYRMGREQTALIMETIGATGIRISELKYITVAAVKSGKTEVSCKGKKRQVYLVKELREKLLKYCRKKGICKGSVFVSRFGNPLDRSNIWSQMKAIGAAAGICPDKVFPHNLRHLFARVFWEKWKDLFYLADILGHSNVNTTRIYTMTTVKNHGRRMQVLGLVT